MGPARILVVDDQEFVRRGLASLLSLRDDFSICGEAEDGLSAVERAKALRPDVVLMDVSMPRMNGLDATQILRRELPEVAVVVISQNDPAIVRSQALQVDAAGYVAKSDLARDLIPTLDSVLQKRTQGVEDSQRVFSLVSQGRDEGQPLLPGGEDISQPNDAPRAEDEDAPLPWLTGSSEMNDLIRAKNWSETPIGPAEKWSPTLRMMVNFLLANRFPLLLWWGPQYISIYNDAYHPVLGTKHPKALGMPVRECWSEIWHILQPLIDTPFKGGPATWMEDLELEIRRSDFTEETHFTVAYSPVPDATAASGIGGVLATVHEITQRIVSERRVAILADLSARAMEAKTAEGACGVAAEVLAAHSKDVPFALIYLVDQNAREAKLAGTAGTFAGGPISALAVEIGETSGHDSELPLAEAIRTEQMVVLANLEAHFEDVPRGPWREPPHSAVLVPIRSNKEHDLAGVLVAGVSSRLALDPLYRSFFELVAAQIAAAISHARAYEDERKKAEALAEIDRAKTVFFSNVSHEFRTPLTLMLGPLDDLLARGQDAATPEAWTQLEVIHRNGLRLLKLVNTLLDFSRIEAGRAQASFVETDLATLTSELASVFRSAMEKGGLQYTIDCPPLPEPVFIDRDLWEKIVFNLLSNAFKFTLTGEVKVTLHAEAREAVLNVRDTGFGIPNWELSNIFKRFHRIENTRARTHEGTGIGLALAQELVKLHGGAMTVESEHGIGTVFHVRIPFGKEHLPAEDIGAERTYASTALRAEAFVDEALTWLPEDARERSRERSAPPVVRSSFGTPEHPRVLLAEDNADMRDYVHRLLSSAYTVEAVSTGAAALEAARQNPPALILSDIMMPEMNGLDLVRHLRAEDRFSLIPIILLSARAGEESRIEGVGQGADDYLTKPFSARELLARVAAHLELARLRRHAEERVRQRTAQFETLLNEAPIGVYLVDADFRIRQVNPTALPVFGDIPDLIGRDFEEVMHVLWPRAYANEVVERFRHTLETGEPYSVPEWIKERRDRGVTEYYEWQMNRIPLPEGRHGVVCYFRDISSQKHSEEALRKNEERFRTLSETLEEQVRARTAELEQRNTEVLTQAEQLRELSTRLQQTQDNERRHIARELHDSAGQIITALGMNLASMTPYGTKNPVLGKTLDDSQKLVQQLNKEIRTTSYLLHPPLLDENGLPEAIPWYIDGLMERSGLSIELDIAENFGRLPGEMEVAVFRIIQECLTNIHRHSGSKTATVRLSRSAESVVVKIQDQGKGMRSANLHAIHAQRSGVGITGMRERVRHLNGAMDIHSNGAGTKISVTLPISTTEITEPENALRAYGSGIVG